MLEFLIKLLIPEYVEYQEEFENQLKSLERELKENER